MNIVWFTWKDKMNPTAGGAEQISSEMAKRLVKDGHSVTVLTSRFKNSKKQEVIDGYTVVRVGNRYAVYFLAAVYFIKNLRASTDFIIEEINTIPFMTQYYSKCKRALVVYQLCREIWFYQMMFPISLIGYLLEPVYLFLLRKNNVITESESTKQDLQRFGFMKSRISVMPVFIEIARTKKLEKNMDSPTILSFGSIRPMKRTLDQVKAFEIARKHIPNLKLIIAGEWTSTYGRNVKNYSDRSQFSNDISFLGPVDNKIKFELFRKSHILLITSIKEGWGLTVTEAASQGTPTIGYNVDGLRDSIKLSGSGKIVEPNIEALSKAVVSTIRNYKAVNATKLIQSTRELGPENTYNAFKSIWGKIL